MRLRPPPSPVRRARVARALGRPRGRSLCFRVKSEITADLSHTHIVRRPTDDLQTTGSRESAGGLAAAHERADARWVRCARRRRAPLPRARRAGGRAARSPEFRSGTGGASRRSRVVTTRSQAHNAMPSTPCRQRAEHKTINYRLMNMIKFLNPIRDCRGFRRWLNCRLRRSITTSRIREAARRGEPL